MKWSDIGRVMAKVAPFVASAIGTPLAGTAVTVIEGALGLTPKPGDTPAQRQDAAANAVSTATTEQLAALKAADQVFAEKMAQFGFADAESIAKLANADRANSRAREVALRDWTPKALALAVTTGFFGLLCYMAINAVPAASKDVLNGMLGALGAGWMSIVSYYFGSSNDRKREAPTA